MSSVEEKSPFYLRAKRSKLLWNGKIEVDNFEIAFKTSEETVINISNALVNADLAGKTRVSLDRHFNDQDQKEAITQIELCPWDPDDVWLDFGNDWHICFVHQKCRTYDYICVKIQEKMRG
jgi:hypothetical protein